ncbi:MAG: hypothetical protein AAB866_02540 [Patescibacteria group bacterium]
MFNLLPEKYKKKLKSEYNIRLTITVFLFSFFIFLVACFFLLPSYLLSKTKENEIENRFDNMSSKKPDKTNTELSVVLQNTKKQLTILNSIDNVSFVESLKKVIVKKVPGIVINNLAINETGSIWKISVSGIASNRDVLILFKTSLESEKAFSGVDLPFSNLAKNKDIPFTITVRGTLKQ